MASHDAENQSGSSQQAPPPLTTAEKVPEDPFSVPRLKALVAQKKTDLGERHPDTVEAMLELELAERFDGAPENAMALLEQVLKIRREDLGEEHRDTLVCLTKVAEVHDMLGQDREAEDLQLEVLETRKRVLGDLDLDTINSKEQLAIWYQNRAPHVPEEGGLAKAEQLFRSVLDGNTAVHGRNHEETLASADRLAIVLRMQSRFDEAETLQLDTVERSKTHLGEGHEGTLASAEELELTRSARGS